MSYLSKFVSALVGLLLMAFVVSWELFLFVIKRDPSGLSTGGGRSHGWLALGAGMTACIAGALMFRFFGRHEKIKWSKVELTPTGPLLITALGGNPFINPPTLVPFDAKRWALANPWLSEGQPDDRIPMDGSVKDSGETSSGQRAFARRTHQLMFKKWSQARHG
jgi:hypothetical protein